MTFSGLHHVTGITSEAQANVDFYVGVLGLRLVKRTVNHNDDNSLHLFYGDAQGSPGSLLSFFVWPGAARGRQGVGQPDQIGLTVPRERIGDWMQRLLDNGVRYAGPTQAAGSVRAAGSNRAAGSSRAAGTSRLAFTDPDGLPIELVGVADAPTGHPWAGSSVPAEMQIRTLHHVTFWSEDAAATGRALERPLGLSKVGEVGPLVEYRGDNNPAQAVYIRSVQGFWPGAEGAGAIHHVAFRANDPAALDTALGIVIDDGLNVSDVREHGYFQSLYFREPGGSLIELATDRPGFTLDEPVERLGEALTLPPEWEPRRREIEAALPTFELPGRPRRTGADLGWIHRFERDAGPRTLLLLHGTGADETQLLEVGRRLAPEAHLLAVRGRSLEEGSPRYFRRYSATTYDQAHLLSEAEALTRFVNDAAPIYGFDRGDVVAVGYSNGANIALAALSHWPKAFAGAVLLRPVMVMEQPPAHDLSGLSVLVLEGRRDPFLPFGRAVVPYLQERGARVRAERLDAGHELTDTDLTLAGEWLAALGSES